MWSQPATARQISTLKAHGNFDGKYYSKGRAGQAIGESVRAAGSAAPAPAPHSYTGGSRGRAPQPAARSSTGPDTGPAPVGQVDPAPLLGELVAASSATLPTQLSATPSGSHRGGQRSGSLSFSLFDELEERHLGEFQREHVWGRGDGLRNEVKAWADLRIKLAKKLADAHAELVDILDKAPVGTVPDPSATASELLAAASPHGLEERHLREYQREHVWGRGDGLRDEVTAWVRSRIELARINARAVVDLLDTQAAQASSHQQQALPAGPRPRAAQATGRGKEQGRPKTPRHPGPRTSAGARSGKGRTYLATVVRINPHGAVVSLDNGEEGWLHVSQLRVLNGGARLESVSDVLENGQRLRARGIGTTDRGQVRLALVGADTAKRNASDSQAARSESADTSTPPEPAKRHRFLRWRGSSRSKTEQR